MAIANQVKNLAQRIEEDSASWGALAVFACGLVALELIMMFFSQV